VESIRNSQISPKDVFGGQEPLSIGVQTVLFNSELNAVMRSASSIARAAELAISSGLCKGVSLHIGDSSSIPCLATKDLINLRDAAKGLIDIQYQFFDQNLGSAGGQNKIYASYKADMIFIQNPDVVVAPRAFEILLGEFLRPGVGIVEAKQLPIEHPKDYDVRTGETSWATGACSMIPYPLFHQFAGYDSDNFFLYCDDVDLSWRVRLAGFKVLFQPAAVVFHDKRLDSLGRWQPSEAEKYYAAEAALLLPYKWSREDLTAKYLGEFTRHDLDHLNRAAANFELRQSQGRLPPQLDSGHKIGEFIEGMYARHRFSL
jgi:GT2 family glycosyltransferase